MTVPAPMTELFSSGDVPQGTIKLGSRKSLLALKQAEIVSEQIRLAYPQLQTKVVGLTTFGDQVQNRPLYSFGGKSLWTKELEVLLYEEIGDNEMIDLIVHSLKDMPTNLPAEFELGCILKRADPRDALVMKAGSAYKSLADLPDGSIVGTSSVRRSSQLLKNYPKLQFKSVRGNIHTRLKKLDDPSSEYSCLILAAAGLIRVDLGDRITQCLNPDTMYHAVGQGALGLEIRKGDPVVSKICAALRDEESTVCCMAERSLLRFLEGGCSVPVGVTNAYDVGSKVLTMSAIVLSTDGQESIECSLARAVASDADADAFGEELGRLLIAKGAKKILDEINYDRILEVKNA